MLFTYLTTLVAIINIIIIGFVLVPKNIKIIDDYKQNSYEYIYFENLLWLLIIIAIYISLIPGINILVLFIFLNQSFGIIDSLKFNYIIIKDHILSLFYK